jgi:hypothetical protein
MILQNLYNRPQDFILNHKHYFNNSLLFAGLSKETKTYRYWDSSKSANHAVLTNPTGTGYFPQYRWKFSNYLKRWILDYDIISGSTVGNDKTITRYSLPQCPLWSCCFWFYPRTAGNTNYGRVFANDAATNLMNANNGMTAFALTINSSTVWSGITFTANRWTHCAFIGNGSNILTYYNGILSRVDTYRTWASGILYIGNYAANPRSIDGSLADFLFYKRALTANEVFQLSRPNNSMLSGLIIPFQRKPYFLTRQSTVSNTRRFSVINSGAIVGVGV